MLTIPVVCEFFDLNILLRGAGLIHKRACPHRIGCQVLHIFWDDCHNKICQKFRVSFFQMDDNGFVIGSFNVFHIRKRRYQRFCSFRDTGASLDRIFHIVYGNVRSIVELYAFTQCKGVGPAIL